MTKKPKTKALSADLQSALETPATSPDQLKIITAKAMECASKMREAASLAEYLTTLTKEITMLRENTLPDAMAAAGLEKFTLKDGTEIKVGDFMRGSLPKEESARRLALDWLIENEAEDLIKTNIELRFGRGKEEKKRLAELRKLLKKQKLEFIDEETVHPQTLCAFGRERLKANDPLPLATLGLYAGRSAKITLPKEKGK